MATIARPLLGWLQLAAGAAVVLLAALPTRLIEQSPSLCPFKNLFGVECYGCGMTRAVSCLLHGNLSLALHYNRGAAIVLALLLAVAFSAFRIEPCRTVS